MVSQSETELQKFQRRLEETIRLNRTRLKDLRDADAIGELLGQIEVIK